MSAARCAAAHPDDPTLCTGPHDAVTVLDANNHGVTGCVHHAARLLASLVGGRVYSGSVQGAAITVFKRAAQLQPFPWLAERPPVTPPRRITIRTLDAGDVTFTDPAWCAIEHTDATYRADIAHSGEDQRYRVPTSIGDAHVTTSVGRYEFGDAAYTRPYLSVEVDVVMHPDTAELLEETAAALEEAARYVRTFGSRLAVLQAEGEQR